ncbi:uncharacterized protein LOC111869108 isoform X2 [Cryptotermes secundus]|uniref:uncharacterized protein LOC111869108 isoform X2 n=1 Tax=Cryptotermes secundus TaxID=105785 RepID=UPI001454CEEE|nr:uncharacterized protein LOC111869108 isoform X2 [Cryptotermes secundus]
MARSTGNLPGCLVNMYYQESSVPKWFICTAVLHGLPTSYLCPEEANIKASKSLVLQLRRLTICLHLDLENVKNGVGHGTRLSPNAARRESGHAVCTGQGCKRSRGKAEQKKGSPQHI